MSAVCVWLKDGVRIRVAVFLWLPLFLVVWVPAEVVVVVVDVDVVMVVAVVVGGEREHECDDVQTYHVALTVGDNKRPNASKYDNLACG